MSKKQKKVFAPSLLVIALTLMAMGFAWARSRSHVSKGLPSSSVNPGSDAQSNATAVTASRQFASVRAQPSSGPRIEAEIITITPRGFEPAQITRPPGAFLLKVDNRAGLVAVALRLDSETGSRLRDVRIPREQLDWDELEALAPGRYVLTEANHPTWICHITITAP